MADDRGSRNDAGAKRHARDRADHGGSGQDLADPAEVEWVTCATDGCTGIRLAAAMGSDGAHLYPDCKLGDRCWAHANGYDFEAALRHLSDHGKIDARGVTFPGDLPQRLLTATPRYDEDRPVLNEARFDLATFEGNAKFVNTTFTGSASFTGATLQGFASFDNATFSDDAAFLNATFYRSRFGNAGFNGDTAFQNATFREGTTFEGAAFRADANFYQAVFHGPADFGNSEFHNRARFTGVVFHGAAKFYSVGFEGDVELRDSPFGRNATIYGATFLGHAEFVNATFRSPARFNSVEFHRTPEFVKAAFHGEALFNGATFHGDAELGQTTFQENAQFRTVAFQRSARFDDARFGGRADFGQATFAGAARFSQARFQGDASFDRATFGGPVALFNGTVFVRSVSFHRAVLGDTTFDRAVVGRDARFRHTVFERVKQLGPMLVGRSLVLDNAVFHERVQVDVSAVSLCARRARFLAGTQLRVRWADILLDDADLATTSILTGEPSPFPEVDERRWGEAIERLRRRRGTDSEPGRPRLISLQRADVAGLTVAGVDLRACRFIGTHNLDQLRIQESDYSFPPRSRKLVRRHTIAEEHHWRTHRYGTAVTTGSWRSLWRGWAPYETHGWYEPAQRPPQWADDVDVPTPAQVAAVYRDLRKGREDAKDEPGAAYFYYGEMEMRLHATSPHAHPGNSRPGRSGPGERLILTLYWLLSGYGLRARRALVALAIAILAFAVGFAFWGFDAPNEAAVRPVAVDAEGSPIYELHTRARPSGLDELPDAIRFSAQSTAALLRGADDVPLTAAGEWMHLALRLIGPVLFGLTILAIRGRVKR